MERAELSQLLAKWRPAGPGPTGREPIQISATRPEEFMKAFAAAVAGEAEVFLCDPSWGEHEQSQLELLLQLAHTATRTARSAHGWLMIPTGGTSGPMKFTRHDQDTLEAAVRGFTQHFSLRQVNAFGVLPLHHVSGLMAWLRCVLSGGEYAPLDWKRVESGDLPALPAKPDGWVISLVPTQLERLLRNPSAVAWLQGFRIIFLGGAPAWPELLEHAAAAGLSLSVGYGMTETAAMATALRPAEFLGGVRDNGAALPHARVLVNPEGVVMLASRSLFRGYYPYWENETIFTTGDLGRVDERGHLTILGRRDGVIISGGEKIQPTEVEGVLRATGEFDDVTVLGIPDLEWGEIVVAAYPASRQPDLAKVEALLRDQLAAPKRPKRYEAIAAWPLNAAGKVNRAELKDRIVESSGKRPVRK